MESMIEETNQNVLVDYSKILYKDLISKREIYDIPVEFYSVSYKYFSGESVVFRFSPIKAALIDTTRKDYSYVVDRFVSENITTYLSSQEQTDLSVVYRKTRNDFQNNPVVQQLNAALKENIHVHEHEVTMGLKEEDVDAWKTQMSMVVEGIPFENMGFGSQNAIKMELALKNSSEQVNMVLLEEPENNLSYTNMTKLINHVKSTIGKQIFISTHSSFVANKLDFIY